MSTTAQAHSQGKPTPIQTPTISRVARAIFPGGKAVLVAYDTNGTILLGIRTNPKSISKWALKGVSAADRRTMAREVEEHYADYLS